MLKRVIGIVLVCVISLCSIPVCVASAEFEISAESAVLIIADTGQIIYEKNAYEKRGMASTTKIMTAIVALEYGGLYKRFRVGAEDVAVEGTSLGLDAGDYVDVISLVKGMLLSSGNDSANVISSCVGGDLKTFVQMMNEKALEIGMESTCFQNPSGLTEDGHFSTAYDMALLGAYAIKNKLFRTICASESLDISFGDPPENHRIYNHNKLLSSYDGAIGVKTGFTQASGRCLVSAAERDGVTLVAVTLNASDDWNDHKKMLEYGFGAVEIYVFSPECPTIDVVGGVRDFTETCLQEEIKIPYVGELPEYSVSIYAAPFLYAEVQTGDNVGCICLEFGNSVVIKSYIISAEDVPLTDNLRSDEGFLQEIKEFLRKGLS